MWLVNQLVNAATNYATGNNLLGFVLALALAGALFLALRWLHKRTKALRVEPFYLILGGTIGMALSLAALIGGLVWQWRIGNHEPKIVVSPPVQVPTAGGPITLTPNLRPRCRQLSRIELPAIFS